ncbi:MAG: helix-turn-helix domain-containing protein [Fimbriimonadaceae bacterium]
MSTLISGQFSPSNGGLDWKRESGETQLAWQSNGGAGRLHPARAFPMRLVVSAPAGLGRVSSVVLRGVFALYSAARHEPVGAIGASVTVNGSGESVVFNLVNGRHYGDALDGLGVDRLNGDGTHVVSVGESTCEEGVARVDELRLELPRLMGVSSVEFRDTGTPASFAIFEVLFVAEVGATCPFRGHGGQISLSELGSIVRLRDWGKFDLAVDQLRRGILVEGELDEAKGSVLTFLAVVSAAILEFGGSRKLHRFQLDSARRLDELNSVDRVGEVAGELCMNLVGEYLPSGKSETSRAIDQAVRILERRFAQEIADEEIAAEVGLSTSHFRHLFKERTGSPFHKYVLNLRLEKARQEILATGNTIREIAVGAGFVSSAHFSRVFSDRFGLSPKQLRDGSGGSSEIAG